MRSSFSRVSEALQKEDPNFCPLRCLQRHKPSAHRPYVYDSTIELFLDFCCDASQLLISIATMFTSKNAKKAIERWMARYPVRGGWPGSAAAVGGRPGPVVGGLPGPSAEETTYFSWIPWHELVQSWVPQHCY